MEKLLSSIMAIAYEFIQDVKMCQSPDNYNLRARGHNLEFFGFSYV